MAKRLVILESPYGTRPDGTRCTPEEIEANVEYARECMLDSLQRGEAPFAPHLLYTQVLNDADPEDREAGMGAGFAWAEVIADSDDQYPLVAFYTDRGITEGMQRAIEIACARAARIEFRRLGDG